MSHTPGPWTVHANWRGKLFVAGPKGEDDRICNAPIRKGEGFANVRLIAAAPDLLAACRAYVKWHDDTYDGERMSLSEYQAIEMMRAAIAKAEGRP